MGIRTGQKGKELFLKVLKIFTSGVKKFSQLASREPVFS